MTAPAQGGPAQGDPVQGAPGQGDPETAGCVPGREPFRILCVCEGNIARSPVAALLLRSALGPGVEVTSAGTHAVVGAPVVPPMRALLGEAAAAADGFRARQLERGLLREADLVLTMTRRQRGQAVELEPAAVRRTFTLRELARLLAAVDPAVLPSAPVGARLRAAVPAAVAQRRYVPDPRQDDIADPYGREEAAYRRAYAEIAEAVARAGAVLAPGTGTGGGERGHSTAGPASRVEEQNDAGGTIDRDAASTST